MSEFVTIVNRTDSPREGVWDGKPHVLPPGKSEHPKHKAIKFVEQNPIMGSEDPRTGDMKYYLGIEELRMDCTPLTPDADKAYNPTERWNREHLTGARPSEVVAGDNGLYSGSWRRSQPADSTFVNPDS